MASTYSFLEGGEELGEMIRNTDWSKTSLGSPDRWPDSLTSAVSIVLNSGFPIAIYWGTDFSLIYNDPWSAIPGKKHPWALGRPGQEVWPEIWKDIKEEFVSVLLEGRSYRRPDAPLYMHRFGYTEECYFDYTLSPIKDKSGSIGGVFNAVIETTFKVINTRRNKLIVRLMNNKYVSHDVQESVKLLNEILKGAEIDMPFFALFGSKDQEPMQLIETSGLSPLNLRKLQEYPIEKLDRVDSYLFDTKSILAEPVSHYWPEAVTEALVVPIAKGEARFKGYLLCGVSARKRLDEDYRNFLQTVGMHVGTILNNALAYELSEAYHNEQALNEELAAANEELAAINEELVLTQEHLNKLNNELEDRVRRRTADLATERDKLKRFFMQAPAGICILSGPELVFELVNKPYQELLPERELLGRPIFDALPEIKDQPVGDILRKVYQTGEPYEGKEVYIPTTTPGNTILTDRYFNFYYEPRRNENREVEGIMAFVYEVTELVEARKRTERTERDLRSLVMTSHYPLMILRGRDYIIEVANQQLAALWNRSLEDILGRRLLALLPELIDQPFPALLKGVYDTGEPYGQEEEQFHLDTENGRVTKYVSFYYDPLKDDDGSVAGIIVAAADITERVRSRQLLEESYEKEQSLNEEITATNEELAAANEELMTANEELSQIQADLAQSLSELGQSEARFRSLIQDAPIAIAVLRTRELIIEAANTVILNLWGKKPAVIGSKLAEVLPELKGQSYLEILDEVFTSGKTYKGAEARSLLEHNGEMAEFFVNFVYQPLFDEDGSTNAIMVVASDVTPQVMARRELEKTKDSLKMAFDAAELGNFDMDLRKGTMFWDKRCRTLFGISHDDEVTFEKDFIGGLHPDDRERIVAVINNVFIKSVSNGDYDVEYRTVGMEDQKVRWVRAKGKAYFDEADQPVRFVGAVLDITEQKLDEIRKNDFIGMASHELKTPLTSLSAYVQILLSKAKKQEDQFSVDALTKVNQQVRKMTAMISGFLNVSRLESGKIHLEKQPFVINELLESIAEEMGLIVSSHDIRLEPCPLVTIYADRDKVGSVVTNLLSNAVKYSPKRTVVTLACRLENNSVKVTVTDKGLGIRLEDQAKLFERYYRVEDQQVKYVSGFGIGLYLSAEIIQRHNGQIGVESEPGKGSTFWFTLPL